MAQREPGVFFTNSPGANIVGSNWDESCMARYTKKKEEKIKKIGKIYTKKRGFNISLFLFLFFISIFILFITAVVKI
jgi:hypothetical protein